MSLQKKPKDGCSNPLTGWTCHWDAIVNDTAIMQEDRPHVIDALPRLQDSAPWTA